MKPTKKISSSTLRFSGDSGDGMQLTGSQFTDTTALMGNTLSTYTDYPAEIRAPLGSLPGVSSFQIQFADHKLFTPGDQIDVLIAMNPAALKVNLASMSDKGIIIVNQDVFTDENLKKANWTQDPIKNGSLSNFSVIEIPMTTLTKKALEDSKLKIMEMERCKNFFALGVSYWLYERKIDYTIKWIQRRFATRLDIADANIRVLKAGYAYAEASELLGWRFRVGAASIGAGTYRRISGNEAIAMGLIAAGLLAKKTLFYSSYPITPASEILHELAKRKNYDVKTFQAEDEIAACGAALGASFGGHIGVTGTSGPGFNLMAEIVGLGVMSELPLVIVNVQRGGPSTGMPTKTEQSDLLECLFGRNGESPAAVIAPKTPADCFTMAVEAARLAVKFMVPVIVLSDGYLANGAEPWKIPEISNLPKIDIQHPKPGKEQFFPYLRNQETLARPWGVPGTPGLEHRIGGLCKADVTGFVSYDPENNQKMTEIRLAKIAKISDHIPLAKIEGSSTSKILVLGWGSTYGIIHRAVDRLAEEGIKASQLHLSYINPFPKNLGEILYRYDKVLVPEMNMGQLLMLIRAKFPGVKAEGLNKVKGQPFKVTEIMDGVKKFI